MSGTELNGLAPAALLVVLLGVSGCIAAPNPVADSAGASKRTRPIETRPWPGSGVAPNRMWVQPFNVPPAVTGLGPQPTRELSHYEFLTGDPPSRARPAASTDVPAPFYVGTLETLGSTVTLAATDRSFKVLDVIYDLESRRAVHAVLMPESKTAASPLVVPHSALRYDAEEECFRLNLREELLDTLPGATWMAHLSKEPASINETGTPPAEKEPAADPYVGLFTDQGVSVFKGTVQSVDLASPEGSQIEYVYLKIRDPKNQYRRALIAPDRHLQRVAPDELALEVELEVKGVLTRDKKGPLIVARSFQVKGIVERSMRDEAGRPIWSNTPEQDEVADRKLPSKHYVLASRILGREQENGVLNDIIFDGRTGALAFVEVKDYEYGPLVLPYSIITFVKDGRFKVNAGRALLKSSPRVNRIPSVLDDPSWGEEILRYYGLAPDTNRKN